MICDVIDFRASSAISGITKNCASLNTDFGETWIEGVGGDVDVGVGVGVDFPFDLEVEGNRREDLRVAKEISEE